MEKNQSFPTVIQHVDATPGVRSGKPSIKGTRITVADVVLWTEQGMSPDELITQFPSLTLGDVHAALAFYHDNRSEIDRQIQESRDFARNMKGNFADKTLTPGVDDGDPVSA